MACLSYFYNCYDKILPEKQGRGKGLFPLKVTVIMVGESQWQNLEASGHMAPTVKKQRAMKAGAWRTSFFSYIARPKPREQ